eukprot:gnl/MRDRNA2_/MRDRNA2_87174_c0_seq1.p1 gnl/MRDRNA2_/MRDRNA2_87174_c0~~gnl/MRDRNA2_/MRDRNA2_87174_c0_seq1.p1  ORF type:complete len:276 (-),score=50.20 gnl/MRDRNA2_/MRDRNA2_87174_c0_seq1:279-1106(-)
MAMVAKLYLYFAVSFVVGTSSSVPSLIEDAHAVRTTTARRRRRSSSSSTDAASIEKSLKELTDSTKELKKSVSEGLDAFVTALKNAPKPAGGSGGGGGGGGGLDEMPDGHYVGFYSPKRRVYLRMHGQHFKIDASGTDGSCDPPEPEKLKAKFPKYWGWEKFWTKSLGGGKWAFYNGSIGKFMNANANGNNMGASQHGSAGGEKLGGWEPFTVEFLGGGKIKLKTHKGKYVRLPQRGDAIQGTSPEDEITFILVDLGKAPAPRTPPSPPPPRRGG